MNKLALARGQTLAQMALGWVLRHPQLTSALIGASSPEQVRENVAAVSNCQFSPEEIAMIDRICPPSAKA